MHRARTGGTMGSVDQPTAQAESPIELIRRIENIVRLGTVEQARHAMPARVRVRTGKLLTNWIPWMADRAAGTEGGREWWPARVGEQCVLLSPGGDLLNAVALAGGVYSDASPQPSESPTVHRIEWAPENFMQHDSATGELVIQCSQAITLRVGATVLRVLPEGATVTPDLVAAGHVSLVHHTHIGVTAGASNTGEPA